MIKLLFSIVMSLSITCFAETTANSTSNIQPQKKELLLVKRWLASKKTGNQAFIIDSDSQETTGVLHWDLTNENSNYWRFEYSEVSWEIKDSKLIKLEGKEKKTYSCIGFSAFLKHPIAMWSELLEIQNEVERDNTGYLLAHYNKKPMIWKYQVEPFMLLGIAIEDSSNRYYQIDFQINESNNLTQIY